jgi:hypothetical protein
MEIKLILLCFERKYIPSIDICEILDILAPTFRYFSPHIDIPAPAPTYLGANPADILTPSPWFWSNFQAFRSWNIRGFGARISDIFVIPKLLEDNPYFYNSQTSSAIFQREIHFKHAAFK